MTDVNDGFELNLDEIEKEAPAPKRKSRAKAAAPAAQAQAQAAEKTHFTITIDEVEGMPNYEVVGVNGKIYQIMRGIETKVPAEVVTVLRHAVQDVLVPTKVQDANGVWKNDYVVRQRHAIPFHVVG